MYDNKFIIGAVPEKPISAEMLPTESTSMPTFPPEEKKPFCSLSESIFALAFFFAGYFFIKLFLFNSCGIAAAGFLMIILICSAALAKLKKAEGSRYSRLYFILSAVFSLGTGTSSNGIIRFMDFFFAAVFFALWAFALNNPEWQGFGKNTFFNIKEAVFGVSTRSFTACPKAAYGLFRRRSGAKNIGYAMLGLLISLPVTVVVCALLVSADDGFGRILDSITDGISLSEVWIFAFGLPVSFLVFGIVYAAVSSRGMLRIDTLLYEAKAERMRFAPVALVCSFAAPLCMIYVLFFFSQLSYFVSAFGEILPEGFSASEYARQGFFELCAVSVINLFVIAAINLFSRRREEKNTAVSALTVILSVFTLILIATTQSKMFLYISRFGLTSKRVYTSWFMFILAAVFMLITVSRFKKFPAAKIGAAAIIAASLLLSFCNVDALIAHYDASLIESGVIDEFPTDLSADAALVIREHMNSDNETLSSAAKESFADITHEIAYKEWFERTIYDHIALYASIEGV